MQQPQQPPPRLAALALAGLLGALCLVLPLQPASAAASSSSPPAPAAAAFLGPAPSSSSWRPWSGCTRRQAASSSGSSGSGGEKKQSQRQPWGQPASQQQQQQKKRLVVDPADFDSLPSDLSFDALIARAHEEKLQQERASLPPPPPRAPTPGEEQEVLAELTGLLYHALNERSTETMARLWLEDDPHVLFFAGDGEGPVKGYGEIVDMLRKVRQEERRLDPGRSKGPLLLHPPVEISDVRVVVNGMHAWVTCKETMARGLTKDHPFDPKQDYWVGTNFFRRFNGQWRLVMHWSGRLAPVYEQLQEVLEQKKAKEAARQQGGPGGGGRGGGAKGSNNMPQRFNLRPEDLGLPPGMSMDGAEAEITWELDEEDLADLDFEEGEEGEWEIDPQTGGMAFTRVGVINEDGTITYQKSGGSGGSGGGAGEEGGGMGLLDTWHRTAVFREKTKKALGAVRRIAREGRITPQEKAKLIHSVIASTSLDEVSQVEMAYDLLVKRGVGDLEEFADQCKAISAEYAWGYQ